MKRVCVYMCIVGRGFLTPYFMKTPYIAYHSFFTFCATPHQPPPSLLFLLPCFFGWMRDRATFDVLFYLMTLWIYKYWVLVPYYQTWTLLIVLCNKASHVLRFKQWCSVLLVLWFDITHINIQTKTQHTEGQETDTPI